jgi:hypothetical protein
MLHSVLKLFAAKFIWNIIHIIWMINIHQQSSELAGYYNWTVLEYPPDIVNTTCQVNYNLN